VYLALADEFFRVLMDDRDDREVIDPAQPLSVCGGGSQDVFGHMFPESKNTSVRELAKLPSQGGLARRRWSDDGNYIAQHGQSKLFSN
jgi:hypothetical protein